MVPLHSPIALPRPRSCERVQLKLKTAGEQIQRAWRYQQLPKMPSQPCWKLGAGNVCAKSRLNWSIRELRISALGEPNIVKLCSCQLEQFAEVSQFWNAPPLFPEKKNGFICNLSLNTSIFEKNGNEQPRNRPFIRTPRFDQIKLILRQFYLLKVGHFDQVS